MVVVEASNFKAEGFNFLVDSKHVTWVQLMHCVVAVGVKRHRMGGFGIGIIDFCMTFKHAAANRILCPYMHEVRPRKPNPLASPSQL